LIIGAKRNDERAARTSLQGTRKGREKGPKSLMMATLSPDGQGLRLRILLIATQNPMIPDCRRSVASAVSSLSGKRCIMPNQPVSTPSTVVTVSHRAAK
jgi:hypothetical protein